jgi:hypothetical protein
MFAVSMLVSIIGLEIGIRYFLPVYDPSGELEFRGNQDGVPLLMKKTNRMWKNTGDYDVKVDVNQYGLRDTKDFKDSTAQDWFVVGDSFSMGHGVEASERYSNILQKKSGIRVYNISIPGDLTGYEILIAYAQKNGATIENLIIGFCMENDVLNYTETSTSPKSEVHEEKNGILEDLKYDFLVLKYYLKMHLATYNACVSVAKQSQWLRQVALDFKIIGDPKAIYPARQYSKENLLSSVGKLVSIAKNFNTLVLIIPSRGLWYGDGKADEKRLHREFVSRLTQEGLTFIDLRPIFEASGNPLQYHFQYDGHWNRLGHEKAADVIFQHFAATQHLSSPRD